MSSSVVGGRIAGSLTGLRLAARGVSVRVLESRDLPSDTLSTHFFRGDGLVRSLDEVGALDEVSSPAAGKITGPATEPSNWIAWPLAMIPLAAIGFVLALRVWNAKPKGKDPKADAKKEPVKQAA